MYEAGWEFPEGKIDRMVFIRRYLKTSDQGR